jgi:tetratricopeptide (TPR) repeat protein
VLKTWLGKRVRPAASVPPAGGDPLQAAATAVRADHYHTALAILDAALLKHPGDDTLLWSRGRLSLEIGQAEQAVEDFTAVLQRHPSAHAFTYRGLAYRQLCRFRDEMADYDRAVWQDPQFTQAYFERAFTTRAASRTTGRATLRRPAIAGPLNGSSAAPRVAAKRPGTGDEASSCHPATAGRPGSHEL